MSTLEPQQKNDVTTSFVLPRALREELEELALREDRSLAALYVAQSDATSWLNRQTTMTANSIRQAVTIVAAEIGVPSRSIYRAMCGDRNVSPWIHRQATRRLPERGVDVADAMSREDEWAPDWMSR